MKLTFITNAACIYESKGFRLLSDPWLTEGAFEGSWFHNPPIITRPEDVKNVNALYISHIHPDHLDPETLKVFDRNIPVVVLNDKYKLAGKRMFDLGFRNLKYIADKESIVLGPFHLTMFGPFTKHPHFDCEIGNIVDSALAIDDGTLVLNANDNTPSIEAAKELRSILGKITVAQLNYNAAGPYPACFSNLGFPEKRAKHFEILHRQMNHMYLVAKELGAVVTMPFAGDYRISGDLNHKNNYLGTTNAESAANFLRTFGIPSVALYERQTLLLDDIRYPHQVEPPLSIIDLKGCLMSARANLWKHQGRMNYFPDINIRINGRFLFNFNSPECKWLENSRKMVEPFLDCTLSDTLLSRILKRQAHWNNAEIGCHIEFYRQPDVYMPDVHLLMSFFHVPAAAMVKSE